jgi:membrane fusion protein (multidrug efflux system)
MNGSSNPSPGPSGSAAHRGIDPQGAAHGVSPLAPPQTSEIPAGPEPDGTTERDRSQAADRTRGLFRGDFLRAHRLRSREGDVLRLAPPWIEQAYWTCIVLAVAGLLYGVFGRLPEYASGPGVIRFSDRADLAAVADGTVITVDVVAGQHVTTGQVLAGFYSKAEASELERVEREFELQLVNVLRDPSDQASRQSMAALRAQRDEMRSRLEEKAVTATIDGTVSDVRIHPGQYLLAGDPVLSIVGRAPRLMLVAFIPGEYRPLLRTGLRLKLRLTGYPYVHQELGVTSVGDEIVGPGAIRRYLGHDIGDAVSVNGPAVLVQADLPQRVFRWEGRDRPYYDGMQGRVDVGVRNQSVFVALVPGLRALVEKLHG